MSHRMLKTGVAIAAGLFLAACSLAPVAQRPTLDMPAAYAEAQGSTAERQDLGQWQPAEPADHQPSSPWWDVFGSVLRQPAAAGHDRLPPQGRPERTLYRPYARLAELCCPELIS